MKIENTTIKKRIEKYFNFIVKKPHYFVLFVILIYLYSTIHEYVHYYTALTLGYSGDIIWGWLSYKLILYNTPDISLLHKWIISTTPYLFNLLILTLMFLITIFSGYRKNIVLYVSFFPFFDTIINFIMLFPSLFLHSVDDFLNILQISFIYGIGTFILTIIFIALLIVATCWLFIEIKKKIKILI